MSQSAAASGTVRRWWVGARRDVGAVAPTFVVARVAVLVGWLAAGVARGGTEPTMRLRGEGLLAWDGTWYRDIAVAGYDALPDTALRFFPLYPLLARWLAWPLGGSAGPVSWVLVVLANVAALAAAVALYRLVLTERGDARLARLSAGALALFPTGFVLVWAYSEALFLLGAIGVFWGARTRHWWWAAVAGVVAGATRPLGVFLVPAAFVEALRAARAGARGRELVAAVAAVVAPLAGTGVWLAWVGRRTGDWLFPFTSQSDLRGEAVNPIQRLWEGFGDLFGPEALGDGLHVPFAVAFVVLVVVVARTWPVSYTLFALGVLVAALAADNLNSLERYALNAFPVVLAVAGLCTTAWRTRVASAVGVAGLVSLSALAWVGTYVP